MVSAREIWIIFWLKNIFFSQDQIKPSKPAKLEFSQKNVLIYNWED